MFFFIFQNGFYFFGVRSVLFVIFFGLIFHLFGFLGYFSVLIFFVRFGMSGLFFFFFFGCFFQIFKIFKDVFARITIFRSNLVRSSPGFFNDKGSLIHVDINRR